MKCIYMSLVSAVITNSSPVGEPSLVISYRDIYCTLGWMAQRTHTQRLIWGKVGSSLVFSPHSDHRII